MVNLTTYKKNITSEAGEDGILEKIFEIIGSGNKTCVEFGAGDGKLLSNSYNLVNHHGWGAVYIESDKNNFSKLKKRYELNKKVICLKKFVDLQEYSCLDKILSDIHLIKNFDLLSIDIDGNDYHIWDSIKEYAPRVVVIENNGTIPLEIEFVCPRNSYGVGSSSKSLVELGKNKGYELVAHTGQNCIFVNNKEFKKLRIKDNSLNKLFSNSQIRYIMSTYGGRRFSLDEPTHGFKYSNAYTKIRKFIANVYKTLFRRDYVTTSKIFRIIFKMNNKKAYKIDYL